MELGPLEGTASGHLIHTHLFLHARGPSGVPAPCHGRPCTSRTHALLSALTHVPKGASARPPQRSPPPHHPAETHCHGHADTHAQCGATQRAPPTYWTQPPHAHAHRPLHPSLRWTHTQGHPHSPRQVTFIKSSSPSPPHGPTGGLGKATLRESRCTPSSVGEMARFSKSARVWAHPRGRSHARSSPRHTQPRPARRPGRPPDPPGASGDPAPAPHTPTRCTGH